MRQLAWLHTTPKNKDGKPQGQSRLDAIRNRGEEPIMPDNPAAYLTNWLFEIGPSAGGSMGEATLGYRDFSAWQEVSGVELMPWEARLLRSLSGAYLAERQRAEALDCPAPYTGELDDLAVRRKRVSQQVAAAFAGLKRKEG